MNSGERDSFNFRDAAGYANTNIKKGLFSMQETIEQKTVSEICYCKCSDLMLHLQYNNTKGGIIMMNTYSRPVRDLRNNYNEIIELANTGNQVIITQNGKEAAVIISPQAFRDIQVFLYKQYINSELAKAEEEAKNPNTKWLSDEEVWSDSEDEA